MFLFSFTEPADVVGPKSVLATAIVALALIQVLTMSAIYGWIPPPSALKPHLKRIHLWEGRLLIVAVIAIAVLCIVNWGPKSSPGRVFIHSVVGISILVLFAAKVVIIRRLPRLKRVIPVAGLLLFALLTTAWSTSALYYWSGNTKGYSGTEASSAVVSIGDAEGQPGVFQPAAVTVKVGQVVQWDQQSKGQHTVSGKGFDSGPGGLATGAVFKAKFDTAGDFNYVCNFHGSMKGVVHVTP